MGNGGFDTSAACCGSERSDAGVCERGDSHTAVGGILLFVPEKTVHQPIGVGCVGSGPVAGRGLFAVFVGTDGVRLGTSEWTDEAMGAGGSGTAEPGVPGAGGSGGVAELLATGIGDGPAAISRGFVWSPDGDGVLPATSDRNGAGRFQSDADGVSGIADD